MREYDVSLLSTEIAALPGVRSGPEPGRFEVHGTTFAVVHEDRLVVTNLTHEQRAKYAARCDAEPAGDALVISRANDARTVMKLIRMSYENAKGR